ncbi:MAG: lamin tail domain-containing protein, partial [Thermoplasmata archaeon]
LVVAVNNTFDSMISAMENAQFYYRSRISGFRITEFSDADSGTQRVEVFNNGRKVTNLSAEGFFLSVDGGTTPLSGNWDTVPLPTYGHGVFTLDPGENIGPEGATIGLYQDTGGSTDLMDIVGCGQKGSAPDPLTDESVARRFDIGIGEYTEEWLRNASTGPTWGVQNNVGYIVPSPSVVLNSVMFNPLIAFEGYVEIMYTGPGFFNISGYKIICDDEFTVPQGIVLGPTNRFFVLNYTSHTAFFSNMEAGGDNVYLYDRDGNLLDMVGWSTSHTQGRLLSRSTDGVGAHQGYDDITSSIAGWAFDQLPILLVTEFCADTTSTEIEIFNPRGGDKALSVNWHFEVESGPLTGTLTSDILLVSTRYATFTVTGGSLVEEGDTISLYYDGIALIEEVSFGLKGTAPDPLAGESTARFWDSQQQIYGNEWTRDSTPTFGDGTAPWSDEQNDVPPINPTPDIVLNEVMFHPSVTAGGYIVIVNKNPTLSINVRDYFIVCDTVFQLSGFGDIVLDPYDLFIVKYSDNGPLFDNMEPAGDNVYLYNSTGSLLDMMGWSSSHLQGMSVRRGLHGGGTYDGFDDVSSEAAGWIFNTPLDVLMSEISDSESEQAQIEVYNPFYPPIEFGVGFTFKSQSTGADRPGYWMISGADSGEYAVFNATGGLDWEGDAVTFYQNDFVIEETSFGQKGVFPDPLSNESVERYWDGTSYTDEWGRNGSSGPSFGLQNGVPPPDFTSQVVLNEILVNPVIQSDAFIEIYMKSGLAIDISGYKIVGDIEYIIPEGTELTDEDPFFYLTETMAKSFFAALNPSGDNVYLYDNSGRLLDMAGWSSPDLEGTSMCRVPNGNGTRDGFDDISSTAAGWVMSCIPTIRLVKVTTLENMVYGNRSEVVYFSLTITNMKASNDVFLISNSTLNGYDVAILDGNRNYIITMISIPADSSVNITVAVTLPIEIPFIDNDNITVTIQSENSTLISDNIILQTILLPFIWPDKYAVPQEIYINGTGHDEISTIVLNLTGMGYILGSFIAQDVIFCVDTSGSMHPDWVRTIRDGLNGYVDEFAIPDRGAVVVFNSNAYLMNPLSEDYGQLRDDIQAIPDPGGSTAMAPALQIAIQEMLANGISQHYHVIILLSDGKPSGGSEAVLDQANISADNGITIYTIGLGSSVAEDLLKEVANITGGQYFYADNASQIPEIYKLIASYFIRDTAGRDTDTSDAMPMVRDVLPPWIDLVQGSFNVDPDVNYVNETGYRILEWNISEILINEIWQVTFQVKANRLGWIYANDIEHSRIHYNDCYNRNITQL